MILDLAIIVIIILSVVIGSKKGILQTGLRFASLILALVLGVMMTGKVSNLLYATSLDERMMTSLYEKATDGTIDLGYFMPKLFSETFMKIGDIGLRFTVRQFTAFAITVFSFLLIVFIVWLITFFLIRTLRKNREKKTIIGRADSSAGMIVGAIKGVIIVCLLLAFMFPLAGIFIPDKIPALNEMLSSSFIAGRLYDSNPLLYFIKNMIV